MLPMNEMVNVADVCCLMNGKLYGMLYAVVVWNVEKYKNKFDYGSVYVSQHVGQRTHSLTSKEDEFNQFIRWSGDSSLIDGNALQGTYLSLSTERTYLSLSI